jgi:hypothetical protein
MDQQMTWLVSWGFVSSSASICRVPICNKVETPRAAHCEFIGEFASGQSRAGSASQPADNLILRLLFMLIMLDRIKAHELLSKKHKIVAQQNKTNLDAASRPSQV